MLDNNKCVNAYTKDFNVRTIRAAERLQGWSVTRCRIKREIDRDEKQMAPNRS